MKAQFTLRDLLWLTVVAGLAVGWSLERRRAVRAEAGANQLMCDLRVAKSAYENANRKLLVKDREEDR